MKSKILPLLFLLAACSKAPERNAETNSKELVTSITATGVTDPITPDHIVVVLMENKGYSQIIGSKYAPYINSLLNTGTLLTNYFGVAHPSYPNYIALMCGSTKGHLNDDCIDGQPYTDNTLYNQLKTVGKTTRWHSENLPSKGSTVCHYGNYYEKHNASTVFKNTPGYNSSTVTNYVNYPFTASFWIDPANFTRLQTVNFVVPNIYNDMHGTSSTSIATEIQTGDNWLKKYLKPYIDWSLTHNSLFILSFDEDYHDAENNRIVTLIIGQHVQAGITVSTKYDHYSLGRSILQWEGASAALNNFATATTINGFWK